MKRIQSACVMQTIHFQLKDDLSRDAAVRAVREEYGLYLATLEQRHTKYRITDEQTNADGSITVRIIKQYNAYSTAGYLD